MIHRLPITVLASALLLALGGIANAASIQPSLAFAEPEPVGDALSEAGSRADDYQATFGLRHFGGQFTGGHVSSTSRCDGGSFGSFACTVMNLSVRRVIDEIYTTSYPFRSHTHSYRCRDFDRPPTNQVPEPSAAVVFGLGALIVGTRSRRR